jgi:hypothetical protein
MVFYSIYDIWFEYFELSLHHTSRNVGHISVTCSTGNSEQEIKKKRNVGVPISLRSIRHSCRVQVLVYSSYRTDFQLTLLILNLKILDFMKEEPAG